MIFIVTIKTRKGTFRVNKKQFVNYMSKLWEYAQARKAEKENISEEKQE